MRPMSDDKIRAMQERVWGRIGPALRIFAHFFATFVAVYLVCGFFGSPVHFSRFGYWLQLVVLLVPLALYARFGMFKKEMPRFQ